MRISKVYTRTGDEGQTSLGSGERVSKASPRVAAYGDVDELNSFLGLARAKIADPDLLQLLERIQNELFVLGADLAVPLAGLSHVPDRQRRISAVEIESLEKTIDRYNKTLPPLEEFILPAGNEAGAVAGRACPACPERSRRERSRAKRSRRDGPAAPHQPGRDCQSRTGD